MALAEERNFRKAAERVHLSQPAFSRSIQAAEDERGLKLFDRGTVQALCTPAGLFVVQRARKLMQDCRALERDVALYRDRQIGDIAFGMGALAAAALLSPMLLELRSRFPAVHIRVQVNNAGLLLDQVRNEKHDFFVGDIRHVRADDTFDVMRIGSLPGRLYVRRGHPLLERRHLKVAHLVPYGLAASPLPEDVQLFLMKLMGRLVQEGLPVTVECDDPNVLKKVALSTDAVLVATPALVREEIDSGKLYEIAPLDLPDTYAELGIVSLRGRSFSPVADYAVQYLVDQSTAP